jgi:hypothetical protein
LIVRPIVLSEPGSYRERRKFLRLVQRLTALKEQQDVKAILSLLDEADELLLPRLRTEDGSSVEDALDKLSANDFDGLLNAIAFENAVGEANGAPSSDGTEGSPEVSHQTGSKTGSSPRKRTGADPGK